MSDLVAKVAIAIMNAGDNPIVPVEAEAAIAAVLDDLAEPTEAMRDAGEWAPPDLTATWQAMLAAKRKDVLGDE